MDEGQDGAGELMSALFAVGRWLLEHPLALLCGLLAITCAGLGIEAKIVSAERDAARAKVEVVQQDYQQALGKIGIQNAAVSKLKAASDAQAKRVANAQQEAAQARKQADARVRAIQTAKVPTSCLGAVHWGQQQAAKLSAEWGK